MVSRYKIKRRGTCYGAATYHTVLHEMKVAVIVFQKKYDGIGYDATHHDCCHKEFTLNLPKCKNTFIYTHFLYAVLSISQYHFQCVTLLQKRGRTNNGNSVYVQRYEQSQ